MISRYKDIFHIKKHCKMKEKKSCKDMERNSIYNSNETT